MLKRKRDESDSASASNRFFGESAPKGPIVIATSDLAFDDHAEYDLGMKKRTVVSLDFDGCSAVLNPALNVSELDGPRQNYYLSNTMYIERLNRASEHFQRFLTTMTEDAPAVSVYVGSNRQSFSRNRLNKEKNKNGCVFETLSLLCEERTQKGTVEWTFEPYLLADEGYSRGEALKRMQLIEGENQTDASFIDRQLKTAYREESKVRMILKQMHDARQQYPQEEINFNFVDDRDDLLMDIAVHLPRDQMPLRMTLTLSKYDFIGWIFEKPRMVIQNMYSLSRPELDTVTEEKEEAVAEISFKS